jgi:hypothetical protein
MVSFRQRRAVHLVPPAPTPTPPSARPRVFSSHGMSTLRRPQEITIAPGLIDSAIANGLMAKTCAMDKGYDATAIYDACEARVSIRSSR